MTTNAPRAGPPLAKRLARRLLLIAGVVMLLNSIGVGLYYGADRRALEVEVVAGQVQNMEAGLDGHHLAAEAAARALYADHPAAYAFALIDRSGAVLDTMNPGLIPPGAADLYADDWITSLDRGGTPMLVAGHEFIGRDDGLRLVFVMASDPARLLWRAYLDEFYEHVWLPILPLVLVLIAANTFLIRRGLAPVSAAAAWARNLRPGAPTPPPTARMPAEIADLVDATQRSVARLAQSLEAERRLTAEAAHALRTPVAVLLARVDALPPGEMNDRIRADIDALSRTVQQVLASARADGMAQTAPLDLRRLAETVTAALAPFAYSRGVDLMLDLPDAPVMVSAHAEGADLALRNLVENAIVHGGTGPVEISVGPGPCATVRDHGPGLPEGGEERLFDPFWRGPSAAPGGAGLGLAIVDRAQRAQGGTVSAQAAPGGGAAFTLRWETAAT